MSDDAQIRASHAQRLLDDPILMQALADIRSTAIAKWESTSPDKADEREWAWMTVKNINRIEQELKSVIDDGKIAAARVQAPLR